MGYSWPSKIASKRTVCRLKRTTSYGTGKGHIGVHFTLYIDKQFQPQACFSTLIKENKFKVLGVRMSVRPKEVSLKMSKAIISLSVAS